MLKQKKVDPLKAHSVGLKDIKQEQKKQEIEFKEKEEEKGK
jgi:hypothetical protein